MRLPTQSVPPIKESLNELEMDLMSVNSLNPFHAYVSSSRNNMFSSSHIAQRLVIEGSTPRYIMTGAEIMFAKGTFNVKFYTDSVIIKVIQKYKEYRGLNNRHDNPKAIVIYEDVTTKEVSVLEVPMYSIETDNKHQHFGFRYKLSPIVEKMVPGAFFKAGTVIAESPDVSGFKEHNTYCYGLETNVAFMSLPGTIEDGIIISKGYQERIKSKGFEKRVCSWGKQYFPLNLYGDETVYKPFPDIGETLRSDGLLFALRGYDTLLGPIEMNKYSTRKVDYMFDRLTYGVPNARVIDVNVYKGRVYKSQATPVGMEVQTEKYWNAQAQYYTEILELYDNLNKNARQYNRTSALISPQFSRLLVEAIDYLGLENNPLTKHFKNRNTKGGSKDFNRQIQKLYRKAEVDDWRVEVVFEYVVKPTIGSKLSTTHGGKGVICQVWEDEDMPVDADGNRAELITDSDSIIKRTNVGTLYEHWINAASRDVRKRIINHLNDGYSREEAWQYLFDYYKTVSPLMAKLFTDNVYKGSVDEHLNAVLSDAIRIWIPPNNPADMPSVVKNIQKYFPPTFGPVRYGKGIVTTKPVLIASVYILVLEKTGTEYSGTSSAKLQHFGIPAKANNTDKYSMPARVNPVRFLGEAEIRRLLADVGGDIAVDLLDQSNSPSTHKALVSEILKAEKPTAFKRIIDRRFTPLNTSRSHLYIVHGMQCCGIEFVREIDDPIRLFDIQQRMNELEKE